MDDDDSDDFGDNDAPKSKSPEPSKLITGDAIGDDLKSPRPQVIKKSIGLFGGFVFSFIFTFFNFLYFDVHVESVWRIYLINYSIYFNYKSNFSDGDDMFSDDEELPDQSLAPPKPSVASAPKTSSGGGGMFDDEFSDDEDFFKFDFKAKKSEAPAAAKESVESDSKPAESSVAEPKLFEDDPPEVDLFGDGKAATKADEKAAQSPLAKPSPLTAGDEVKLSASEPIATKEEKPSAAEKSPAKKETTLPVEKEVEKEAAAAPRKATATAKPAASKIASLQAGLALNPGNFVVAI